jgi:sugar phosphate isomerase/epimerase
MLYGAMNHPVYTILGELDEIAGLGFDYLELTMDPPEAHYSQVDQLKDRLRKALDHHRMQLICHMPTFVSLADLTETIRQASLKEVLESLKIAAKLEPIKIVAHPAYIGGMGHFVMDLAKKYALESVAAMAQKADELGLTLCLENMFPRTRFCVDVDDFIPILKEFPTLQLTLDTGHANIDSPRGKRTLKFIETFGDRIGHLHVSDNFGKEDNHLPLGSGNVKFPKIINALKKIGYDKTVTFEVFTDDREYLRLSREKFDSLWNAIPEASQDSN